MFFLLSNASTAYYYVGKIKPISYNRAKQRYMKNQIETSAQIHLASAAEAGGMVCLFTNPIWLVKTRLQLQTPQHHNSRAYSGFGDALKTILKDEGWRALYIGILPGLFLVRFGDSVMDSKNHNNDSLKYTERLSFSNTTQILKISVQQWRKNKEKKRQIVLALREANNLLVRNF